MFAGPMQDDFLKVVQPADPFLKYARLCMSRRFGSNPAALRVRWITPLRFGLWAVLSEKLVRPGRDRKFTRRMSVMMKRYRWEFVSGKEPECALDDDLEYLVMCLAYRHGMSSQIDLGPGNVLIRPNDRCDLVAADPVA